MIILIGCGNHLVKNMRVSTSASSSDNEAVKKRTGDWRK